MATGIELPHSDWELVAKELRNNHVIGCVVFDLLASNGSRARRFYSVSFNGDGFSTPTRLKHIEAEPCVREAATRYLRSHLDEFDLSLLTPAMRFAASRGIAL